MISIISVIIVIHGGFAVFGPALAKYLQSVLFEERIEKIMNSLEQDSKTWESTKGAAYVNQVILEHRETKRGIEHQVQATFAITICRALLLWMMAGVFVGADQLLGWGWPTAIGLVMVALALIVDWWVLHRAHDLAHSLLNKEG